MMAVNPQFSAKTVQQLTAYAEANPVTRHRNAAPSDRRDASINLACIA
jgi:hypothetical protein